MKREPLLAALARHAPSDEREAESLAHIRRFLAAPQFFCHRSKRRVRAKNFWF